MANVLVIDGHPDPERGFCHAAAQAYLEGARETGNQTRLIRLADSNFPVLRSAAEFAAPSESADVVKAQEDVLWADHIVLIFPLWLGSAPAHVRAFFEQLSRANFIVEVGAEGWKPRLRGKTGRMIVTMGMPTLVYRLMFGAHGVQSLARSVLGFAGVRPVRMSLLGNIEARPEVQRRRLERIRALGARAV